MLDNTQMSVYNKPVDHSGRTVNLVTKEKVLSPVLGSGVEF